MAQDDVIGRLARQIDATWKSEQRLVNPDHVATLRRQGACELHRMCAEFVTAVNDRLSEMMLELSPPTYSPEMYREPGVNLMQISSQGRQLQIAFEAPTQLASTEKFAVPYVLEGEVRTYNQKMLERFDIRSHLIFFSVEKENARWHFFDWRTRHSGQFDRELLVSLMEPLF